MATIKVLVVGAGGGGKAGQVIEMGGGGGGECNYQASVSVTPGDNITVTIGEGAVGTDGGNSSFGAISATGGKKSPTSGASGGASGDAHTGGTGGDVPGTRTGGGGGGGDNANGGNWQSVTDPVGGVGGVGTDYSATFGTTVGASGLFGGGGGGGCWKNGATSGSICNKYNGNLFC